MKEKINRIFGIVVASVLVLYSIFFIFVHKNVNVKLYSPKTWLLLYPGIIIICFMVYLIFIYPIVKEMDYRMDRIVSAMKLVNQEFDIYTKDRNTFDNMIEDLLDRFKKNDSNNHQSDESLDQFKGIMAKNIELIYNISKSKNEKEIEGLAKSLLDIIDFGAYHSKIFVPLVYEVLHFENLLFGCIYSEKNSFEIIIDINDQRTKKALVLNGILSSIANLFNECSGKPKPIKNVLQLTALILNDNLNIRVYYNNILENIDQNMHLLDALRKRLSLYYHEGTYRFDYYLGDNYFTVEISVPYIEIKNSI